MKTFLIVYATCTFIWPLFFWVFNEDDFYVPIGVRVAFLYLGIVFILASISMLMYVLFTKTQNKKHLLILGLVLLNSMLFVLNPGNLIDRFLG
jgi:hypothetical protein